MDLDVDKARLDLAAVRLAVGPERYANAIWRMRLESAPKVRKPRWNWPIRRLVDAEVERRNVEARKNVVLIARYQKKLEKRAVKNLRKWSR